MKKNLSKEKRKKKFLALAKKLGKFLEDCPSMMAVPSDTKIKKKTKTSKKSGDNQDVG